MTPVDENGVAEIVGVPQVLIAQWSARRQELKALGDELIASREVEIGRTLSANERAECFQIAAYRTRTPKIDAETSTAELRTHWLVEAQSWGLAPERWLASVTGRASRRRDLGAEEIAPLVIARLEEKRATWGRSDVVEEVARLVVGTDAEETRMRAEALADRVLADAGVVSLAGPLPADPPASLRRRDGMAALERHGALRFSTRATLRREAAILEGVDAGRNAQVGVVEARVLERALAGSPLGEDQREAVRGLVEGGERVALLVGPAGAGKSRALDAARRAWELAGYDPIGLAPSAMAAKVLREEAGVLVLVGDQHQLGSVGPGGIFRTLVADHGAHELETVRRFHHAWEAAASLRLREGNPSILTAYVQRDRIASGSREQMLDRAFKAWAETREQGTSVLLMAGDNATAEELSRRCRAELVARDWVDKDGVRIAAGTAAYGDEVVTLKNDRKLRVARDEFVRNGARWHVVATSPDGSLRVASMENGATVTLPAEYVREHVALGYALTVHKAQGQTVDKALVLVDQKMTAAQLYVAMSRGREDNRAFVIASDDSPEDHVRRPSLDAIELLTNVMRRAEMDRSAHDELRHNLSRAEDLTLLTDLYEEAYERIMQSVGPDRSSEIAALEPRADVQRATEQLRVAEEAIRRATQACAEAESRVRETEREPVRTRLPGQLGEGSRYRSDYERRTAKGALSSARRAEQDALREIEAARSRLLDAQRAAKELAAPRREQDWRASWLREHADEVRWAHDLGERIETRRRETPALRPSRQGPSATRDQAPLATREVTRAVDPATEAVLARVRRKPAPARRPAYESPRRPPPGREGPSLGR